METSPTIDTLLDPTITLGQRTAGPVGLQIAVTEHGTTRTIELGGEFDLAARDAVHQAVRDALAGGPERLVLDFSGLTFIDSSGLHVTMEAAKRSDRQNTTLTIVPGPPAVQRLFALCGITTLPFGSER